MAQYKRIPYEFVEHTEIARKSYLEFERGKEAPGEKEIEAEWLAKRKKLCAALDTLTPRQREVYVMVVGHRMNQLEVAKALGITQQSVSEHFLAADKKLAKTIVNMANSGCDNH